MEKSIIENFKAEEKKLSEQLHTKLVALTTFIQPATDELNKYLSDDMFLKPNANAFFHVMYYLFNLLDPNEFKKRFYWPIVDKKTEASFRASTVQYLNYLNEKHNLQWANIKSYLVVMPGGMKFIVFLLDLVNFIIKELIRHREKTLPTDVHPEQIHQINMKTMMEQNLLYKELASKYIEETRLQTTRLKDNLDCLKSHINSISVRKLPLSDYLTEAFLSSFDQNNEELFNTTFKKKFSFASYLKEPLKDLRDQINRFQQHDVSKFNKNTVSRSLVNLKMNCPQLELTDTVQDSTGDIKLNTLLAVFAQIYPALEGSLIEENKKCDANEFVKNELKAIKTDINHIESQIIKFLGTINSDSKKPQFKVTPIRKTKESELKVHFPNFIYTPPIRLNEIDNRDECKNQRLPFLEEKVVEQSIQSTILNLDQTAFQAKIFKTPRHSESRKKCSAVKNSRIADPIQLLRSLNKDNTKLINKSNNVSMSTLKRSKIQRLFDQAEVDSSDGDHCQTVCTLNVPFESDVHTTITHNKLDTPNTKDSSLLYPRKKSAVQKLQSTSLKLENLNTSPSGKLDPLVTLEQLDFPNIAVLNGSKSLLEESANNIPNEKDCGIDVVVPTESLNDMINYSDNIFDITDTILKDTPM